MRGSHNGDIVGPGRVYWKWSTADDGSDRELQFLRESPCHAHVYCPYHCTRVHRLRQLVSPQSLGIVPLSVSQCPTVIVLAHGRVISSNCHTGVLQGGFTYQWKFMISA